MATSDPAGLIPLSVQIVFRGIEEELSKLVLFKDEFKELADDLQSWKHLIPNVDDVLGRDLDSPPGLWLASLKIWMKDTESLIRDCQAVEANGNRQFSILRPFINITSKLELSEEITGMRGKFSKLVAQAPALVLLQLAKNTTKASSYRKQVIPDELVRLPVFEEIIEKLISPVSSNKWVGIWGIGGSGKTMIAKQINNSMHIVNWFNHNVFFVVIGRDAVKIDVLKTLCRQIGYSSHEQDDEEILRSELHTRLHGKRALMILDDVRDDTFMELLNLVDTSMGSKMFVTTRNKENLLHKHAKIFHAGLMSFEDSKKLFNNHAFGPEKDCADESISKCVTEMIELCKGLPLALVIVGSAIAKKQQRYWEHDLGTIKEKLMQNDGIKGVFQYGYDQLQLESKKHQECFLTMFSFPQDAIIGYETDLMPWWRGEDLIGPLHEGGWEEGEDILRSLVSRSLIQLYASDYGGYGSDYYTIHDVILELGLDHLLKDDLESHERGHIFLTSKKHQDKFLKTNRTSLRKIVCRRGPQWESYKECLQITAFEIHSLETIIWDDVHLASHEFAKLFSRVVSSNSRLMVAMLHLHLRDGEFYFESGSHACLQTLSIKGSSLIKIGGVWGENLKCLILFEAYFQEPQQLDNLELYHNNVWGKLGFNETLSKHLVMLTLIDVRPIFTLDDMNMFADVMLEAEDMTNIRRLNLVGIFKFRLNWRSEVQPISMQKERFFKFKSLRLDGVEDVEDWVPLFSGNGSKLTTLSISGKMDTMQSMTSICLPALKQMTLEHMTLNHIMDDDVGLPAIVTCSELQTIQQLYLRKFRVSEAQALTLHRFQQLIHLKLDFRGPLPQSLIGRPNTFLQLKELFLGGNFFNKEFPHIGKGALPNLQVFTIRQNLSMRYSKNEERRRHAEISQSHTIPGQVINRRPSIKVVQIGFTGSGQLEKLEVLEVTCFKNIPAEIISSPSFKKLTLDDCDELEKLELEPEVELKITESSLKLLRITSCKRMTKESGIPEALKQMEQNGKLEITLHNEAEDLAHTTS